MKTPKIPTGFAEKREIIEGIPITTWIDEDPEGDTRKEVYGVFNGGGAKGAAFGGAIEVYEQQVRWKEVSGASAGAITGALLAAGYDGQSIGTIINEIKFQELMDPFSLDEVKESAYRWQFEEDVDYLTRLLKEIDPSLLAPEETDTMRRKVLDFRIRRNAIKCGSSNAGMRISATPCWIPSGKASNKREPVGGLTSARNGFWEQSRISPMRFSTE